MNNNNLLFEQFLSYVPSDALELNGALRNYDNYFNNINNMSDEINRLNLRVTEIDAEIERLSSLEADPNWFEGRKVQFENDIVEKLGALYTEKKESLNKISDINDRFDGLFYSITPDESLSIKLDRMKNDSITQIKREIQELNVQYANLKNSKNDILIRFENNKRHMDELLAKNSITKEQYNESLAQMQKFVSDSQKKYDDSIKVSISSLYSKNDELVNLINFIESLSVEELISYVKNRNIQQDTDEKFDEPVIELPKTSVGEAEGENEGITEKEPAEDLGIEDELPKEKEISESIVEGTQEIDLDKLVDFVLADRNNLTSEERTNDGSIQEESVETEVVPTDIDGDFENENEDEREDDYYELIEAPNPSKASKFKNFLSRNKVRIVAGILVASSALLGLKSNLFKKDSNVQANLNPSDINDNLDTSADFDYKLDSGETIVFPEASEDNTSSYDENDIYISQLLSAESNTTSSIVDDTVADSNTIEKTQSNSDSVRIGDVVNINEGVNIYSNIYDAYSKSNAKTPYYGSGERTVIGVSLVKDGNSQMIYSCVPNCNEKINQLISEGWSVSSCLTTNDKVDVSHMSVEDVQKHAEGFYDIEDLFEEERGLRR